MRQLSEKYKALALRAGRYPKLRMELYAGTRGAWTDTVEAEYNGENAIVSAAYTNGITSAPSRFETGLAFCGSLEIELYGVSAEVFAAGKRLRLFSGFYDPADGETYEAPVGEFFIESVSAENGKLTLKARDKMMFAEQKFNAALLTYPCSLLDCVREIFRQMGFAIPEDYALEINPTVRAPAWSKPNMTEGLYSDGTYYVKDPWGYSIIFPGDTAPTLGHAYLASAFSLTCREALASAAKMQLGNCFIDGDGVVRFTSYKDASPIGDDRVTELNAGEESFTITSVAKNYMGYDVESVEPYKRPNVEWRGEIMYYTNFPSDLPGTYEPVQSRAVGKTFRAGTVTRKGVGETELGEFIDYAGKMGPLRFFVFGIQYEWQNASFDETLYSFAPDYKGVDREWLNDRDIITDEDKNDEPVKNEPAVAPQPPAQGGLTIGQAVIIKESDAKYLLHHFTELEYNAGNQIGYAGPGNQIVVRGYLAYDGGAVIIPGHSVAASIMYYPRDWTPGFSRYTELQMSFYRGKVRYVRAHMEAVEHALNYDVYNIYMERPDGTRDLLIITAGDRAFKNLHHWGGAGMALDYREIYPPSANYEYGYANVRINPIWKKNEDDYEWTSSDQWNKKSAVYARGYGSVSPDLIVPFASLAEYQAAVGLTHEPLTLTEVTDSPTIVSASETEGR